MPAKPPSGGTTLTTDLSTPGRHFGDAMVKWSDNSNPLGYHPVPVISLKGSNGPVVLLTGGTHGDEFEGPSAIMRLVHRLDPGDLRGQIIAIPALNMPAMAVSSRVSPLDGLNLNRAFPGDVRGSATPMIADFLERQILPLCDAAIDLHSGGKASVFQPCALPTLTDDQALARKNMDLARVFGLPLIWRLGANNDNRSVNSAAERARVPMIATELGGGGGAEPRITDAAETGIVNVLRHLGILDGTAAPAEEPRIVQLADPSDSLYANSAGLFDRGVSAGQDVVAGDFAGMFHFVTEPERPTETLRIPRDGLVLAHTNRGMVSRGDLLALIVRNVKEDMA